MNVHSEHGTLMPKVPQAHLDARRLEILRAAHDCFGRQGIHGTTMRDICEEAGVSVGTVYRYFQGKDDVVRALAEWARLDKEKMVADLDRERPLEAVLVLAGRLLGPLRGPRAREAARLDVRLWAEALSDAELETLWRENYESLHEALTALVREGQSSGEIRGDVPADEAARVFLALAQGTVMLRSLETSLDADRMLGTLTDLLGRGLAAEPGRDR